MKTILAICGLVLVGGAFLGWRAMQAPTRFGTFSAAQKASVVTAKAVTDPI
jgi:hypothetical protein